MSSKRGRKRNDNLPPNRARDVRKAFRARRAAHLDALEQRVAELEEENGNHRAALILPPANRPALVNLGKDKPHQPSALPRTSQAVAHKSPKGGRKRNDNLSPNRARDVQRASRARRAAHLDVRIPPYFKHLFSFTLLLQQALEKRLAELEEENGNLRSALNLPPANRPPLGKGPTGKDKPKTPSAPRPSQADSLDAAVSSGGSSADSPTPSRARSLSPSTITATVRPSPGAVHSLEGGSWDQGMIMGEEQNQSTGPHASSPSTAYPLSGVTPHSKNPSQFSYSGPAQSSSRTTLPGTMYIPTVQGTQNSAHSADRPLGEYGSCYPVRDPREDQQRFPYSQPSYSGLENTHISQYSPSLHYSSQQARDPSPAQTPSLLPIGVLLRTHRGSLHS